MTETVQKVKQARTSAKSAFTKQANHLSREMNNVFKEELQEEFIKLRSLARRVNKANEDYKTGLLFNLGAEEEDGEEVKT